MTNAGEQSIGGGWFADPLGRFDGRYFDGLVWTDRVSDSGVSRVDPDWPPTPLEVDQARALQQERQQSDFDGPERRSGGERRQVVFPVRSERRKEPRRGRI